MPNKNIFGESARSVYFQFLAVHIPIHNALKHLRTLLVTFSSDIGTAPISVFRAAVIEKVGREYPMFYHHLGEDKAGLVRHIYKLAEMLKNRLQPIQTLAIKHNRY